MDQIMTTQTFLISLKHLSVKTWNKTLLGGDFNTVLNPLIDKKNGRSDTNKKCQTILNNIILNYGLTDIWREKNPTLKQFTSHSNTKPVVFHVLTIFLYLNIC